MVERERPQRLRGASRPHGAPCRPCLRREVAVGAGSASACDPHSARGGLVPCSCRQYGCGLQGAGLGAPRARGSSGRLWMTPPTKKEQSLPHSRASSTLDRERGPQALHAGAAAKKASAAEASWGAGFGVRLSGDVVSPPVPLPSSLSTSHSDVEVVGSSQQFQRHLGSDGELGDGHLAVVVLDLRARGCCGRRERRGGARVRRGQEGITIGPPPGPPPKTFSSSPCSACTG